MSSKPTSFLNNDKARVALILLLALLVRLIGIASRPIWYDEAFSILFSEKGIGQMLYGTLAPTGAGSADIHPLGYYSMLWLWMRIFGDSLIAVRILSVLAGLGVVYLVYCISLELFDPKTALTAMLFVALAPFIIHYSQEMRMYAFLALWLLLAAYSFLRGKRSGNWGWWVLFGISAALAQYTHNLAAFFLVPLAFVPIFKKDWKTLRFVILSGCFALLLYFPWLIQLPSQFAKVNQAYWVNKPGIASLFTLLLVFTTNLPLPSTWTIPALTIAIVVIVVALIQTFRTEAGSSKNNALWVLYLTFIPPLLLFLFSQWKPIYIERALLPSGAFFCIWLAWTFHNTGLSKAGRGLISIALVILFSSGIYQHLTYRDFPYAPFKELTHSLRSSLQDGDRIVHSNKLSMVPLLYFGRDLPQTFIADPTGSPTDTLAPATQEVLQIEAEPDIRSAVDDAQRVWYVIYQRSIDEYIDAGQSTHPDFEYLNSNFDLESQKTWDGLQIYLFTKKP